MKKAFHAPALPDLKPARAAMEGRPHGSVPNTRTKNPKQPKQISDSQLCRWFDERYRNFFCAKRPWMKTL
jgi:hypothetical protein